jgi:hypothetical protein
MLGIEKILTKRAPQSKNSGIPKIADRKQDGIPGHDRKIHGTQSLSERKGLCPEFSGSCPWNSGLHPYF